MSLGENMVSVSKITSPIRNTCKNYYNKIPSFSVAKDKTINSVAYIGRKWTSPQQRVIMGATAIVTQPFIDAHNHKVDDETRRASVARTIAKIIVGTTTGFIVRALCIKGIKYSSKTLNEIPKNTKPYLKKLQTIFTPKEINPNNKDAMEQYRNAMGTFLSLGIMLFTNFMVDAPWTKKLTNVLIAADKKQRGETQK